MKKIVFLILISSALYATGPSYAELDIIPVAINSSGDVFCKAYSMLNSEGGHYPVKIQFKYIIIFNSGRIEEIDYYTFDPDLYDSEEHILASKDYWINFHNKGIDFDKSLSFLNDIIIGYGFIALNPTEIRVDRSYPLDLFEKIPVQTTLGGIKSEESFNKLEVEYIVNNLWFINNYSMNSFDVVGALFDLSYFHEEYGNLGYDTFKVTGIIRMSE